MSNKIVFKALTFASEKHKNQKRKGESESPYINHPIKVASILADFGELNSHNLLAAAILHDTIEDTNTNKEEIEKIFGTEICNTVCECTDDKNLSKSERKRLQIESAAKATDDAKKLKIADKICNIMDINNDPPKNWSKQRKLEYIQWCENVFEGLRGVNEALEQKFLQEVELCKVSLK